MARVPKETKERKPRADAQRNHEHLLKVAKAAFTRQGANINLDDLAKEAGLGVGTLYRHFPTRDSLIEAVYRAGVKDLADTAAQLSATHPPL